MKNKKACLMALCLILSMIAGLIVIGPDKVSAAKPKKLTATFDLKDIDKHGHISLSLSCEEIKAAGYNYGDVLKVKFLGKTLKLPLCANYTDVDGGKPGIFAREKDTYVLLSVNTGCFAAKYKIAEKTINADGSFEWNYKDGITGPVEVTISLKKAGAYAEEIQLRTVSGTKNREDYPDLTDKEFTNFREVTTTGMGRGVLYRTSSPINPSNNRNTYADEAIKEAGVTVILNLADDENKAREYEGFDDTYYSTTNFMCLDLPVGLKTAEFESKLADGLKFMAANPGVYAIHCKEGKDRAGYVAALLECFMGATYEEVTEDYMVTFYNYYGVTKDDQRYDAIMNGNIVNSLKDAFTFKKKDKKKDLSTRNLAKCAAKYFKKIGLTDEEIKALRANLSVNAKNETRIALFETADVHGYIFDATKGDENTFQYRLPYIANFVNKARNSSVYDDVLLLDGGDIYQGTPVSNITFGDTIKAAFDVMGYDAVGLGNHEFDWGVEEHAADPDGTISAYSIGSYSGDPDIPILAYNIYYADTGEKVPFTKDYVVVEKAGKRILIVGYIPDYSLKIMAEKISPYKIDEDLKKLAKFVKKVKKAEKPDVTIVLAHEYPIYVAEALSHDDVDVVFGGHDSRSGNYGISSTGIPYVQADKYSQGYGFGVLVIDEEGNVTVEGLKNIPITGNPEKLYYTSENTVNADKFDKTVLDIALDSWDEIGDEMSEVLGYTDTPILKKGVVSDNGATSAGNWITGLMLRKMKADYGVVATFYNYGGIRTSLEIPEGETTRNITVGDIYTINPFNNFWLVYELTGAEMAQQLKNGFIDKNFGDQVSGLTFEYVDHGTAEASDIEIVSITLDDGTEVDIGDDKKTYRVCTSNYSATLAGGVFIGKTSVNSTGDAPVDNVTIIELLREEAKANDGYISVDTSARGVNVGAADEADAA